MNLIKFLYYMYYRPKIFFPKSSYSMFGEDVFVEKFFKKKSKGIYVDVGCFHPKKFSNTYFLYKLGWKGINIDMEEDKVSLFNLVRPKDINICAAISDKEENVKVNIENIFSPLNTISLNRSKKLNSKSIKENSYYVKSQKINKIVKNKFDFLNIDIDAIVF